jgi:hypothetical protein
VKLNALSRRKPATKRNQMRDCNGAECIQSEKACYEAAIPSEATSKIHQEGKEQAEERVER